MNVDWEPQQGLTIVPGSCGLLAGKQWEAVRRTQGGHPLVEQQVDALLLGSIKASGQCCAIPGISARHEAGGGKRQYKGNGDHERYYVAPAQSK